MEPLSVNGEPPQLAGLRCDAILCVEYWHAGRLVEPCNVTYLCFEGAWHRLYFDYGIIFWRRDEGGPQPFDAPEMESTYPVVDLASKRGLAGACLSGYRMEPIERGSCVTFVFENGHRLAFSSVDDVRSCQDV
jgi:hypothetical protein